MPVTVVKKDYKPGVTSDEKEAANKLATLFENMEIDGSVLIASNVSLPGGEKIKDVDIIVAGNLNDYTIAPYQRDPGTEGYCPRANKLTIKSFCITIEVKSHDASKVQIDNLGVVTVPYKNTDSYKNATIQGADQKDSLRNCLRRELHIEPYVISLVWLLNVSTQQLDNKQDNHIGWNILPSTFSIDDFFSTIAKSVRGIYWGDSYILNCFRKDDPTPKDNLLKIYEIFLSTENLKGLCRKKMEWISNKEANFDYVDNGKLTILKGRAGTGKTIRLLQFAYKKVTEDGARCLFLTYNHALLSDVKRSAAICNLPDGLEAALCAQTLNSYMIELMKYFNIELNLDQDFDNNYKDGLLRLKGFLDCGTCHIQDWDYILLDEAQDLLPDEMNIISKLYNHNRIIIADGVDQFVRNQDMVPWSEIVRKNGSNPTELVHSLRQKNNIVKFVNFYAEKKLLDWSVKPSDKEEMRGGRVIITNHYNLDTHKELLNQCLVEENSPYDMLFLVDSVLSQKEYINPIIDFWNKEGIKIFNGTDPVNRTRYANDDESRLFNYNSCRGLEGWVVVCNNLDQLVNEKLSKTPYPKRKQNETDTQLQERFEKYIYQWVLMPLTRAIDTLVITIFDSNDPFTKLLEEIKDEYDFIEWNVN